ncbi:MAG: DUF4271 domain-containing protein [Bacteroidales bacterium]|nr:DUF4271 domain-containing protein [Candidatus Colimorpha onthohippi]
MKQHPIDTSVSKLAAPQLPQVDHSPLSDSVPVRHVQTKVEQNVDSGLSIPTEAIQKPVAATETTTTVQTVLQPALYADSISQTDSIDLIHWNQWYYYIIQHDELRTNDQLLINDSSVLWAVQADIDQSESDSLGAVVEDCVVPPVVWRESLFTGHELPRKHYELQPRPHFTVDYWLFVVLLCFTFVVSLFYKYHRLSVYDVVSAAFVERHRGRVLRENDFASPAAILPVLIMLSFAVALVLFLVCERSAWPIHIPDALLLLMLMLATTVFFSLRLVFTILLGSAFKLKACTENYLSVSMFFMLIETTLILPILFVGYYSPFTTFSSILVLAVLPVGLMLFRLIYSLRCVFPSHGIANVYLFYYLCILEIIPFLILVKVFTNL